MRSRYIQKTARPDVREPGIKFPARVFMYLGLSSISVLFLGFTGSFVYSHFQFHTPGFKLPYIFHANTVIILLSSFTLQQSMTALKRDDSVRYRNAMGLTLGLGTLFLVFQYMGWKELLHNGISLTGTQSASYLYLVSGLHAFHVLGGIGGLAFCFGTAVWRINKPVADLMFITDPEKKLRIGILATYWHFVDVLWLYLYAFFMVMLL